MTVAYTADLLEKVRTGVELWRPLGTRKVEKTTGKKQLFGNGKGWKGKENGGLGMENDGLRQVEWFIPPKNGDDLRDGLLSFYPVICRNLQCFILARLTN